MRLTVSHAQVDVQSTESTGSHHKNKLQLIAATTTTLPQVNLPIQVSLVFCSQRLLVPPEPASSPVSPLRLA
jgi:hypothetical protein